MNTVNNYYLLATLTNGSFSVNIVKYSQTMRKSEYSQANRVFQDRGLGCGSTTQMEYEGTQSVLGMLTTSFF